MTGQDGASIDDAIFDLIEEANFYAACLELPESLWIPHIVFSDDEPEL
jgi:hypothetical protein